MVKQSKTQGTSGKRWITIGILLMVALIGASGCSQSKTTTAPSTSTEQANQGQTTQGQPTQGQRVRNPALQAAMEIRRLQSDTQNALTSDQKEKLKPILQDLINTPNASEDILKQKADAINAVFTDQQKSSLTTPRTPNGNNQNANNSNGNSTKGNSPQGGAGNGTGGKQAGSGLNPQDMYQQVLDSLK